MRNISKTQTVAGKHNSKLNEIMLASMRHAPAVEGNCLDGDTLIMDEEGELYSLEELACEYNSELTVACIDKHGRLTTSKAHSFRIGQWTDKVYDITFSNGQKVRATSDHLFLGASGDWLAAKELAFGTVLRAATYDPCARNPLLTLNEITHVHVKTLPEKIPMYDFTVENHSNLFVAQKISGKVSLIVAHNSSEIPDQV